MAWSFNPTPRRLLQDVRVLTLDPHDRAVLLSLYVGSDEHGRFQHHPITLAVALGMVGDGWGPSLAVDRLAEAGLVHLYDGGDGYTYGQLDQWDADLGSDHKGKRPRSCHPDPPVGVWARAGCDGRYRGGTHTARKAPNVTPEARPDAVRTPSVHGPDTVRTPSEPDPPKEGKKERKKEGRAALSDLKIDKGDETTRRALLMDQLKGVEDAARN